MVRTGTVKVLIIPEDPFLDQYILQPVVARIFHDLQTNALIEVLQNPRLRSINQALDKETVQRIIEENPMVDLFLLVVDRDCNRLNNVSLAQARQGEHSAKLIACLAVEEIEVWMLAFHRHALPIGWREVQRECDPKERFAEPFIKQKGWWNTLGKGRKKAMKDLGAHWRGVLTLCPEINDLKNDIETWLRLR